MTFAHGYPFDPTYGYTLPRLLEIPAPTPPEDFAEFWKARYSRASGTAPQAELTPAHWHHSRYRVFDLSYRSTDGFIIAGWVLTPLHAPPRRGFVVGHGYGGREGPDLDLPFDDAVLLFPCFRGLSRSARPDLSAWPHEHVLCGIEDRHRYIIGGCVDDLWIAVSALCELFPEIRERIGYLGISFGGGIGALAIPWDHRIRRAHLNVPTFGHQALRLTLPTTGSGEAIRQYEFSHGNVMETLAYYDAAGAARHTRIAMHVAAALFDPVVAPPGQFAIYNALSAPKELFVLAAGHFDYPARGEQERGLSAALAHFFDPL